MLSGVHYLMQHVSTTDEGVKARVALDLTLGTDLPPLALDVFKLQQVLVNVLIL